MSETPAVYEAKPVSPLGEIVITQEQVDVIKNTIAVGATDDELKLFFFECKRRGVHPLDRLIHFVVRGKNDNRKVTFQTSIDLFRSQAEDTGEYRGQEDIEYGPMVPWDGVGKNVPEWAKATIKRFVPESGEIERISATAYWDEYYPGESLGFQWRKMPRLMLGKCAEALALRKAFPRKLAGLYTFEEMILGDVVNQGKAKGSITPPKAKSTTTTQEPADPPPLASEHGENLSVRDKLANELSDYCRMTDGEVDAPMFASVLKEISQFGDPPKWITDIDKASEKWCGSALGKLRERTEKK